jgi:cobalt-zinc-cadmium efflux system outer membrane protein
MNPFRLSIAALLLSASVPLLRAGAPETIVITPGLLDSLMAEAGGRSPALEAAGARTQAANAAVSSVRTWDDPTASVGLSAYSSRGFESSQEGNISYGLEQRLPLHGLPDLRRKVAAAGASGEQLASEFENQRLRRDLDLALSGVALAGEEADIAGRDIGWLDATLSDVDHRYRVGEASQVDWLKIQTERATAGDELTTKERERGHGEFTLNRLLNRELHSPWPKVALPKLRPALYYTPGLVGAALAAEPELRIMRQQGVAAQAEADLTRGQRLTDVSVGLEARQYSGDGEFREGTASVSFSLPWLNRDAYDSDWRRDQARKRAADLAAEDYELSVRELLHHHVVDLDAARRQALLYREQLIPLTEQTLSSAQSAWAHNLGPFQDILEAHRMLLADELVVARALTDQETLLAEIIFLTGARDTEALVAVAGQPAPGHESEYPK